ncbi:hypothetical protein AC629_27890 [Bradyrhizobium sp. NAS80.1]|uniref:hypothetical protein n=1 Tax=Bradyrhizobium sp. NAS80.1 TaxID=1680159 RepID=UPI000960E951|nr:hypothetical protein [Bradyrhizobium sp. NAS80.1]OKO80155.1 hypothetical protein AC629_27890 [Bradyrhizobium sp. NAS80.1]
MTTIKLRNKIYDLDEPLRGAKAIAEVRGTSEREVFHAINCGRLEHRKDGGSIISTPREALTPLLGEAGVARLIVREVA